MKKALWLVIIVWVSSGIVLTPAQAEGTSTATTTLIATTTPPEVTSTPEAPRRTTLTAVAQVRLTNLAANVSNQLDAFVRRIDNVTNRLSSRAEKLLAEGKDVTAAQAKIAEAKASLDVARGSLGTIDADVAAFVGSVDPKASWQTVRTHYVTARQALGEAHKAAVEALLLLKTANEPTSTVATSSESTLE